MLKINYDRCSSATGASNENSTVLFAKVGYTPILHSNQFFDYYVGEDSLIYEVIKNGNSQAEYVENGITKQELADKIEALKLIPVKRMVLKLREDKSDSNDFLWKNLQVVKGVIIEDISRIKEILADNSSNACKALEYVKLGVKETDYGFILTYWGYYDSISSKTSIKLLRTEDGQEFLTCPEWT